MIDISHLTTNGKMIFLACDQGMEHGPEDFNERNIDPSYIFDIAIKSGLNAVIFGKGITEKYYPEYRSQIPLILKLNGHSRFNKPDSWGPMNCEVGEAIALGAAAVGYTIHLGSLHEPEMFTQFGKIVREAHEAGVPAIAWVYPRGPEISDPMTPQMTAYAARVGMELGADIVKVYNPGDVGALRWMGLCAGKTKVVISGGNKVSPEEYADEARDIMRAGLSGVAVGRNVWQSDDPYRVCDQIKDIIYNNAY
ncbi:fructose-bisphosphate aldolase [Patescibacteria group bacterium]|nr:fructose-bisphosphate aldolase [Patescibacteria group bacterium]